MSNNNFKVKHGLEVANGITVQAGGLNVIGGTVTLPALVAPVLGDALATTINKVTLTQPATGATLTLTEGSSLVTSGAHSITLSSTADSVLTLPVSGTLLADNASVYLGTTSVALNRSSSSMVLSGVSVDGYAGALKSATTTVSISAATAPTVGQVLTAVDGSTATWQAPGAADLSVATGVLGVSHGGSGVTESTGTVKLVLSTSPTLSTSVLTDSTSFDLINTTATTVNFAGAATTLNLGAATGTTTINNDLQVEGNITFGGGSTQLSATVINVEDPLIYMAENNPADTLDIGLFAGYTVTDTHYHTGIFRDATDKVWKLFSGITAEPVGNVLDLTGAVYDDLRIGKLTTTGVNKVTITQPTNSATLTLADASSLITVGGNSLTLTTTGSTSVTLPTSGTLLADSASVNLGTTSVALNRASGALTLSGVNIDGYATALKTATGSVVVSAATDPTTGYVLTATSATTAEWQAVVSGGSGTVTSVSALTIGVSGSDVSSTVTNSTTTPTITLNIPTASATNRGALSSTDWSTFNGKQAAITFGTGVLTWIGTPSSANLASAITDETGTGSLVFANTPTLVTPILGTPTSGDLSNCTNAVGYGLKSATTTVSVSSATAPTTGQVLTATSGSAATWQTPSGLTSGGALGTPSSGTLTNCTGLPISTGISGLAAGVATFLATPSSANLAAAVTDESGTGTLVFTTTVNGVSGLHSDISGNLRSIPQNNQTAAYQLVAGDNGKNINITTGGITIPSSTFVAGDVISIYNQSGTAQNISWSGPTVYKSGTSTAATSPLSLSARGIATFMFATATEIVASGNFA